MSLVEPFLGAVLTGGKSRRLGRDKTTLLRKGIPLAAFVGTVLKEAGAKQVVAVGGDATSATTHGVFWQHWNDYENDQGPLAGVLSVLLQMQTNPQCEDFACALIFAADTPNLTTTAPQQLLKALAQNEQNDVAVLVVDGADQPLTAAWRLSALPTVQREFLENERSVRAVLQKLQVARVISESTEAVDDVDVPADLDRYDLDNE